MAASAGYQWRRDKDGLGVWEHRGKVAVAGFGHSPVDRRWDEVSMDKTLGAYSILACQKAMDEAGVTPDQVDGIICCDSHIAGGSGGTASQWAPRPYFAPPYDSELGLTLINGQWLAEQLGARNVKFAPTGVPTISEMVGMAAQAVGDGVCSTCLVIYPTGNLAGRYRRGGENADDYARGARQWVAPWGNHGGNDFINSFPHGQYCRKYGGKHDDLAPFVVNQHRNGLMTPWGYNASHNLPQLTIEEYLNSRYILNPLRLWDCDRPVNASTAYLFTTAERARDMKQPPVYVLNHSQHSFRKRSTQEDLDEIEEWTDRAAKRMYEGAGLGPSDVDVFNPYDGYSIMTQFFLEGFQWHGVKRGDSFAFYAGDIRVEGPHPLCSSGGNLGTGRLRTAMYTDSIEQLRGTAGPRQVKVRAETALAAFTTPSSGGWIMFGKHPN
jgi:acetyl-CoA acetyltransferase